MDSSGTCPFCRIGLSLYITLLQSRDVRIRKDYKAHLELTPCDFVALLLDPKGGEQSELSSHLDLVRNCFHQCLALFGNGVSEHVVETMIGYNFISLKDVDYIF